MGELCDKGQPQGGEDGSNATQRREERGPINPRRRTLWSEWSDYHEVVITRRPVCLPESDSPRGALVFLSSHGDHPSLPTLHSYSTVWYGFQSPSKCSHLFSLISPSQVAHRFRNTGKHPHWLEVYITAFQSAATSAHMRKYLSDDQMKIRFAFPWTLDRLTLLHIYS